MKTVGLGFALLCLMTQVGAAQQKNDSNGDYRDSMLTISGFVHKEMSGWKKSKTPVLFAQCLETRKNENQGGEVKYEYYKHMIFVPLGAAKGKYAAFDWERGEMPSHAVTVMNGDFEVKSHVEVHFVDQGGPWEWTEAQLNTEYMLRQGLTLLYPADFSTITGSVPKLDCSGWDYREADPNGIPDFYKSKGWRW